MEYVLNVRDGAGAESLVPVLDKLTDELRASRLQMIEDVTPIQREWREKTDEIQLSYERGKIGDATRQVLLRQSNTEYVARLQRVDVELKQRNTEIHKRYVGLLLQAVNDLHANGDVLSLTVLND